VATISPCTKVCRIGADGLCDGCHRSRDEIAVWGLIDDERARSIMAGLRRRRPPDRDSEELSAG
jgi:uncharacterized protein